jgi:Eukaryotic aspartyl protease
MLKAYRKYNFQILGRASANTTAGTGSQTGTVAAAPEPNAAEYLEKVNIGGQDLVLDFDTGSSDLWVFSTSLSKATIGQHAAFNPATSKSFQNMTGATWSISYGDGSGAAGTVGKDTVNIGGATATSQAVELATAVSQSFVKDTNNDGLVGLAFSKLNTVKPTQQTTFFDTIMPQLAMPVFSVDLRNDSTGSYQFGAIDQTKFSQPLTTVPVDATSGFWQVQSPTFTVGTSKIANQGGSPAIAGTSQTPFHIPAT